jgi:hypothetical protein
MERTSTSPKRLGTYVFVLTKRWNEDDPARWPQSLSRERKQLRECSFVRHGNSNHWAKEMTVHGWVGKYNSGQEFNERRPVKNAVEVLFGVLAGEQLCAAVEIFSLGGPLR